MTSAFTVVLAAAADDDDAFTNMFFVSSSSAISSSSLSGVEKICLVDCVITACKVVLAEQKSSAVESEASAVAAVDGRASCCEREESSPSELCCVASAMSSRADILVTDLIDER